MFFRDAKILADNFLRGNAPETDDDFRADAFYLLAKPVFTACLFFGLRVAVVRRAAFYNVCDIYIFFSRKPDMHQIFIQKLTAPPDQAHALLRAGNNGDTLLYSSFPAVDGLDAAEPGSLADTMPGPNESVITRAAGRVWRIYGSDLLSGVRLYTAFDLTEVFDARSRSLQRFLLLECAVLAGAALGFGLAALGMCLPL